MCDLAVLRDPGHVGGFPVWDFILQPAPHSPHTCPTLLGTQVRLFLCPNGSTKMLGPEHMGSETLAQMLLL